MKRLTAILLFFLMTSCGEAPAPAPAPAATPAPAPAARPADEGAALRILAEINTAQAEYMKRNRRYALEVDELIEARLMREEPSQDATGYEIKVRPAANAGSYTLLASPVTPSASVRHFYSDKTGIIRAELGKDATATSPTISAP
jgi:hypothetical protein